MSAADFPSIEPTRIEFQTITPASVTRSISGRETRGLTGAPRREFVFVFEVLTDAQRRQIVGHIANAKGTIENFQIKLPTGLDDVTGDASGTITVDANAVAGAYSVDYTKVSGSNETVFKAGDFIQFSNHNKIYEVTEDSVSVGTDGTVTFFPSLISAVTASTDTIVYTNLNARVRYAEDISYQVRNDSFSSLSIRFIEVNE